MATIKDVSAYTGLALGTVSKYLNGLYVRPENKILLDQAVIALDYHVNQAARFLKQNSKKRIGVMLPTETTSFYTEMLVLFEEELRELGYSCMMIHYLRDRSSICQKISMLRGIVDGIILISSSVTDDALLKACGDLPVVLIDPECPCDAFDTISVDYRQAAMEVVEQSLAAKQARFGLITEKDKPASTRNLYESYRSAISSHQITIDSEQILECEDSFQAGFNAYLQLVHRNNPPTSILVTGPLLALGVIASARMFGISMETSTSCYVGFTADHALQLGSLPISVLKQPMARIARAACELMTSRVNLDKTGFPSSMCFEAELSNAMSA